MASRSLSQRLAESKGEPVEYEGFAVHGIYRCDVRPGDVVLVHFIRSARSVREGLGISIKRGSLLVQGSRLRDIVLWTDTAPEVVEIVCDPPKSGAVLQAWNVWDQNGITQAWLGNAGMLIEQQSDGVVLKCSDGVGIPDFEDLVVDLRLVHRNNSS